MKTIAEIIEAVWQQAPPGREAAQRNAVLRLTAWHRFDRAR
jgi:hypothetical protein